MTTYITDTNLFFNMEAGMGLGTDTKTIMTTITQALTKTPQSFCIMMPPRIIEEINSFFDTQPPDFVMDLLRAVTIQSPSAGQQLFDGHLVSAIIEESRTRAFRGMKVAEEEIIHAGEHFMGKEVLVKKDFQIAAGKVITKFRERFRTATRTGMIDSLADLDLIMLARETKGALVSSDEGVISWGRKMGVRELSPTVFGKTVQAYL